MTWVVKLPSRVALDSYADECLALVSGLRTGVQERSRLEYRV